MQYASKVSSLNLSRFVEDISKLIKKTVEQGQKPDELLLVVNLVPVSQEVEINKAAI